MNRRALLLLMLPVFLGCSPRDHENPLDPENPGTGGLPRWLSALADDRAVDLQWEVPAYDDLDAVHLVQTDTGEILWVGDRGRRSFRDAPVPNGTGRGYRLVLVLNSGVRTELPEERAIPGTAVPWVYDASRGEVVRLTPDGLRRRAGYFDGSTLNVTADPDSGFVLVVDFFASRIILLDREGKERWRQTEYRRPNSALWAAGGWWVTDSELGTVRLVDEAGVPVYESLELPFPIDLAAGDSSAVWAADAEGPVARILRDQGVVASTTLLTPRVLASAPDGGVWVADRDAGALVRLDANAGELFRVQGYPSVEALGADPVSGGVWVGDRTRQRLVLLDAGGAESVAVPGLPSVTSIAVAPDGSEVWVCDPVLRSVVRLSRDGETLGRSEGLSLPVSLSIAFR